VTPSVVVRPSNIKPVIAVVDVSLATIGLNERGSDTEPSTSCPPYLSDRYDWQNAEPESKRINAIQTLHKTRCFLRNNFGKT